MWDVFFSYSRGDAERVRPLLEILRGAGLKVFTDETGVAGFSGISRTIRTELARSYALLAFYSREYPEREACQWELTAAYLAGLGEGDPRARVMVVNPERGTGHIHPVELRDARHWPWPPPGGAQAAEALVADIQAHLAPLRTPLPLAEWDQAPRDVTHPGRLPGPLPTVAPRFVGRRPELWRVHSALHAHAAPLVTGSAGARAVQIRGMGGIGKTLLAREYAQRFAAAFPGGVCWLNASDERGHATELRQLERRLGTRDLFGYFEARGAPFLYVVDGLPGGLTLAQAAARAAPHPLGRTLFTTRSRAYDALAAPVDLLPLAAEHAAELAGSARLAAEAGGHPGALALLGDAVRAGQSARALLARLYGAGDSLLDALTGSTREPFTAALLCDALSAGDEAMDVLRCAVALSPLPLAEEDVATALAAVAAVPPVVARRRTAVGLAELRVRSILSARGHDAVEGRGHEALDGFGHEALDGFGHEALDGFGQEVAERLRREAAEDRAGRDRFVPPPDTGGAAWHVHPVIVHAWRHHDPAPDRAEALRHAMLRTLHGALPRTHRGTATLRVSDDRRKARQMAGSTVDTPSESERMAAFDIQVELVTRIGVQELAPGTGSLREALTSLHALFAFTRGTLREYSISLADGGRTGGDGEGSGDGSPTVPGNAPQPAARTVQALAHELLNGTLRPFLSAWHPRLAAYEAQRVPQDSPLDHEAAWQHAPALRAELTALRAPLHRIATSLAAISGADFGLAQAG